ncbi:hypothetical protein ACTXT7_010763 [Hymenolepis weldensis]
MYCRKLHSFPLWYIIRKITTEFKNPKLQLFSEQGIKFPDYVHGVKEFRPSEVVIHTKESIKEIRNACLFARKILTKLRSLLIPGKSTDCIDKYAMELCLEHKVYPSPLLHNGFPCSICTSLNNVAIHGIPSVKDVLNAGDLLSVDVTIFNGKAHGDCCETFLVLEGSDVYQSDKFALQEYLLKCARRACEAGIKACFPGAKLTSIAAAISQEAFESGCRVIAGIGGHGIGEFFHGPPYVPHSVYEEVDPSIENMELRPGQVFTIEPVIAVPASEEAIASNELMEVLALPEVSKEDEWSVFTTDKALTAQFEETVLITYSGVKILTRK